MAGDVDTSAPAEKEEKKTEAGDGNSTTGAGTSSNNADGTDNTNSTATNSTQSSETADLLRADGLGTCSDSGNDWVTDFLGNWCGTPPQSAEATAAKPAGTTNAADATVVNANLANQGFPMNQFSLSDYGKDWGDEFAYDYTLYSNDSLWMTGDPATYKFGQTLQMDTAAVGNDATGGNLTRVSYEPQETAATTDNTNQPADKKEGKNWFSRTFDRFFDMFGSGDGTATKTTAEGGKGEFKREGDTVTGETTNAKGDKAQYEFGPDGMRRRDDHGTFERGPDGQMRYKPHSGKSEWVTENGVWKVKGENGEEFWQDKDGVSHISKNGKEWTKGKDGVLRDGAGLEVHDDRLERAVHTAERMYTVVVARKRLEEGVTAVDHALRRHEATQPGGTVQGREAQQRRDQIETVTDADGRTSTIRQTKDGRLTVVTNEDGTTDLIMKGRSGKSMTFHINKEGTEAEVTGPDGKKSKMERGPDGNWRRCKGDCPGDDDDDNNSEAADAVKALTNPAGTGQLQIGTLRVEVGSGGEVKVTDARTGAVQARVDENKTTTDGGAVTTNKDNTTTITNGPGGEQVAQVTGRQGEATVTAGNQTSTVNQNEGNYKVEEGGETVVQSGENPGEDKFTGFEDYTFGPDGTITDSSGTKVRDGNLVTPRGEIDPETGRQWWDDGFEVDEEGNMYFDGEYFGAIAGSEAAEYWENGSGDTSVGDGAIAAASSALSAADAAIQRVMADISAGRKPDPGAIAAAYGALSGVKTSLIMAAGMGDIDALAKIGAVNSALGELDGSRGKADSQLATLQAAEYAINDLRNNGISAQLTASLAAQLYEMGGPRGDNLKQFIAHGEGGNEGDRPRTATS